VSRLFVVSAPSGAGKTTLCSRLLERFPDLAYSISHTTRAPRPGEREGRDYFFVSRDQFLEMIDQGRLLEYAEVFGRYYGTSRKFVVDRLRSGQGVLADVDVIGARQIKNNYPDAVLIFIVPPTLAELERRLRNRGTESEADLSRRLNEARRELEVRDLYDYLVVNDEVDRAVDDLAAVVRAESIRMDQSGAFWSEFFQTS
jgi:guanylate kinase